MESRKNALRALRTFVAIALVAMYAAGLIAMLTSHVQLALILWVVSTLGGIGLLYWLKTKEKDKQAEAEPTSDGAKE